jgi:hypothetical protein
MATHAGSQREYQRTIERLTVRDDSALRPTMQAPPRSG